MAIIFQNKFLLYGTRGGGCKFVIAPPFRRKGGAPAALHTPGYGPGFGSKMLADAELQPSSVRGGEDITAAVN